jgi:hypothetical protein
MHSAIITKTTKQMEPTNGKMVEIAKWKTMESIVVAAYAYCGISPII